MNLLIPCNTSFAQYLITTVCPICFKICQNSKVSSHACNHVAGGLWEERDAIKKWDGKKMENIDAGRKSFTSHLAFRQHEAIINDCWSLLWEARFKTISTELFVSKFVRFLERLNRETQGVKDLLLAANKGEVLIMVTIVTEIILKQKELSNKDKTKKYGIY